MNKRDEIKWHPFNSLFSSSLVMTELVNKKNYQIRPTLSEDEKADLEQFIKQAFHTHEQIQVLYFWQNQYFTKIGIIENGSWAVTAGKVMKEMFSKSKNITWLENTVTIKSAVKSENITQIEAMADELII